MPAMKNGWWIKVNLDITTAATATFRFMKPPGTEVAIAAWTQDGASEVDFDPPLDGQPEWQVDVSHTPPRTFVAASLHYKDVSEAEDLADKRGYWIQVDPNKTNVSRATFLVAGSEVAEWELGKQNQVDLTPRLTDKPAPSIQVRTDPSGPFSHIEWRLHYQYEY